MRFNLYHLLPLALLTGCSNFASMAGIGWPSDVFTTEIGGVYGHNLADGQVIDLAWAADSNIACFPATENTNFSGNHVFFGLNQPENAYLTVAVTPEPGVDVSLYLLQMAPDAYAVPPGDLSGVLACEDSFDYVSDGNPGELEYVETLAYQGGNNVLVGVAGANGALEGGFDLEIYAEML